MLSASAQVTVDTIGGGVRVECGSSSGFVGGKPTRRPSSTSLFPARWITTGISGSPTGAITPWSKVTQAGNKSASTTIEYHTTGGNYQQLQPTSLVSPWTGKQSLRPDPFAHDGQKVQPHRQSSTLSLLSSPGSDRRAGWHHAGSQWRWDANSNVFLALTNGVILRFPLLDSNPPADGYSESYDLGDSDICAIYRDQFRMGAFRDGFDRQWGTGRQRHHEQRVWLVSTND